MLADAAMFQYFIMFICFEVPDLYFGRKNLKQFVRSVFTLSITDVVDVRASPPPRIA